MYKGNQQNLFVVVVVLLSLPHHIWFAICYLSFVSFVRHSATTTWSGASAVQILMKRGIDKCAPRSFDRSSSSSCYYANERIKSLRRLYPSFLASLFLRPSILDYLRLVSSSGIYKRTVGKDQTPTVFSLFLSNYRTHCTAPQSVYNHLLSKTFFPWSPSWWEWRGWIETTHRTSRVDLVEERRIEVMVVAALLS